MNLFIYRIIFFLLLISFCSCSKFLDKKVNTSINTPNSLEVLQALLDNPDVFNLSNTPAFGEASADDYFIPDADYNTLDDRLSGIYIWQPIAYRYSNDWSQSYTGIYYANLCMENVQKIARSQVNSEQWDYIMGASLFHRAHAFLNLAWTFASAYNEVNADKDPGIDLRLQTDPNIPSKRSSVKDAYQRIIEDAAAALAYLPVNVNHVFRPGKAAAAGLLARAYLSMRVYDSAYKYANLSLTIKDTLLDYNLIANTSLPFSAVAYNGETLFYSSMNSSAGIELIGLSYARACIDTLLYLSYDNNDLRKKLFFQPALFYQRFKGMHSTAPNRIFTGLATNEMWLIRSECNLRMNRIEAAQSDLNAVLKKRWNNAVAYQPVVLTTKELLLEKILAERRKELLMRGLRWMDIKRLNKEGHGKILKRYINGTQIILQPNDPRYALPLPEDIINLTNMEQN